MIVDNNNLEILKPSISIEYRRLSENGILGSGEFDNIPEDIYGARICQRFPIVNAHGYFVPTNISYDLFVGQAFDINYLLKYFDDPNQFNATDGLVAKELGKEKLRQFRDDYYIDKVVSTEVGIRTLKYNDMAFETYEELIEAIKKIYATYQTMTANLEFEENKSFGGK